MRAKPTTTLLLLSHAFAGAWAARPYRGDTIEKEETMNKRSAVLVAAGLVFALIAGGLALGYGIVGPSPTTAVASAERPKQREPRIKTIEKTIKVHRKAEVGGGAGGAGGAPSVATSPSSPGSWSDDDDSFAHEGEGSQGEHEGELGDD
jgi:hypothetical protein